MKNLFLGFICATFLLAGTSLNAQDMGISSIMNQVAEGIKPEAFKGSFLKNKDDWMKETAGLSETDVDGAKKQLGSLLGGLKGKAFEGVNKTELIKGLAGVNGMSGIGDLLGQLLGGLNPSMLTDAFKGNKGKVMDALKMLG